MARTRRQAGPGDMLRSLVFLLLPIVVISILWTRLPSETPVKTVDWQPVLATARAESAFPVLAPVNLPSGWRVTQAVWARAGTAAEAGGAPSVRDQWRLGLLSPDDIHYALAQGDRATAEMVAEQSRNGVPDGRSDVAGQSWERRVTADSRTRSLVLVGSGVTTVVSGDMPYEALEAFAGTLSAG